MWPWGRLHQPLGAVWWLVVSHNTSTSTQIISELHTQTLPTPPRHNVHDKPTARGCSHAACQLLKSTSMRCCRSGDRPNSDSTDAALLARRCRDDGGVPNGVSSPVAPPHINCCADAAAGGADQLADAAGRWGAATGGGHPDVFA